MITYIQDTKNYINMLVDSNHKYRQAAVKAAFKKINTNGVKDYTDNAKDNKLYIYTYHKGITTIHTDNR